MTTRQRVIDKACSYLGCHEADGSHRQIIDLYNKQTPLPRGYRVKYTDKWCATFVSAVALECGVADVLPTECGCEEMIDRFKALDSWVEADDYMPQPADVAFYDWDDNGVGDCKGHADHVGLVVNCDGVTIKVIEGNNNDAVGYRLIKVNGRYIRGFGVPKYRELVKPISCVVPAQRRDNTAKAGRVLTVTASALNVRSGPSTAYAVQQVLQRGRRVAWYGYYTGNWYLVQLSDGSEGYVSRTYLG